MPDNFKTAPIRQHTPPSFPGLRSHSVHTLAVVAAPLLQPVNHTPLHPPALLHRCRCTQNGELHPRRGALCVSLQLVPESPAWCAVAVQLCQLVSWSLLFAYRRCWSIRPCSSPAFTHWGCCDKNVFMALWLLKRVNLFFYLKISLHICWG